MNKAPKHLCVGYGEYADKLGSPLSPTGENTVIRCDKCEKILRWEIGSLADASLALIKGEQK